MIDNLLIGVHTFSRCMLTSLSADEILLLRYVNFSTHFRSLLLKVEMASCLKHMYSVLFTFTWKLMPSAACSRVCCMDSTWTGVFARSTSLSALCVCYSFWWILSGSSFFSSIKPFSFIRLL